MNNNNFKWTWKHNLAAIMLILSGPIVITSAIITKNLDNEKLVEIKCTYEIYKNGNHMVDKTFTVKTKFNKCPEERFDGICNHESINCLLKEGE